MLKIDDRRTKEASCFGGLSLQQQQSQFCADDATFQFLQVISGGDGKIKEQFRLAEE